MWLTTQAGLSRAHFCGRVDRLGIRFRPGGLPALLGLAIPELPTGEVPAAQFDLPLAAALQARLASAPPQERVIHLEAWLLQLAARRQPREGPVQRLLPLLAAGRLAIDEAVRRHGLSRRTLERRLRQEVGLTPAQLARFHQLKRARHLLATSQLSLSEIALDCGFHDQAHFTHHFRTLTEETPAAYRRRKLTQIYKAGSQA